MWFVLVVVLITLTSSAVLAVDCMSIQLVPVISFGDVSFRGWICAAGTGCTYNFDDNTCTGTPTACPEDLNFDYTPDVWNNDQRRALCESVLGSICSYNDGGTADETNDSCALKETSCANSFDDDSDNLMDCDDPDCEDCLPAVTFYRHENYGGAARTFFADTNLTESNFNNEFSSLKIRGGISVIVFNFNYSGSLETFPSDIPKLSAESRGTGNWDNVISSFKLIEDLANVGGAYGENTAAECKDSVDNDGDSKTDCQDPECIARNGPNGGYCCGANSDCAGLSGEGEIGLTCSTATDRECHETICNDVVGGDGDNKIDCKDSDCDTRAGTGGTCEYQTELNCSDSFDNDGDAQACLINANCPGKYCSEAGYCVAKQNIGSPCATAAECSSGFCNDKVCCSTATGCASNGITGGAITGFAAAEPELTATEQTEPAAESPSFFSIFWSKIKSIFSRDRAIAGQAAAVPPSETAGVDCRDSNCYGQSGPDGGNCCIYNTNCDSSGGEKCSTAHECILCNEANKYRLDWSQEYLCNGQRWIICSDLSANLPLDPNVEVDCLDVGGPDRFVVREQVCNNGLDDDKDGQPDLYDLDCGAGSIYSVNSNGAYEVVVKSADTRKISVIT